MSEADYEAQFKEWVSRPIPGLPEFIELIDADGRLHDDIKTEGKNLARGAITSLSQASTFEEGVIRELAAKAGLTLR